MLIINNINLPLDTEFLDIAGIVATTLKIDRHCILSSKLYRKSVDARKRSDIHFCVSVLAEFEDENHILKICKNASEGLTTE